VSWVVSGPVAEALDGRIAGGDRLPTAGARRGRTQDGGPVHPLHPLSAEGWKERHISRLLESTPGSDIPEGVVQGLREDLPERRFYPAVSELVAGADGTVWLRREPVDTAQATWEVYDEEGARVGRVHLPAGLRLRHASRQELWGIETDDLDVPYVVGLRVRP